MLSKGEIDAFNKENHLIIIKTAATSVRNAFICFFNLSEYVQPLERSVNLTDGTSSSHTGEFI